MSKNDITAKTLRKLFQSYKKPKEGIPCCVCNKNPLITELHHLVPFKDMANLISEFGLPLEKARTSCVWLCPNCHAYLHLYGKHSLDVFESMAVSEYSEEEVNTLEKLDEKCSNEYCQLIDSI
jgi:hypothetical protein